MDTAVRDEVERIAKHMSSNDGLSDLNLYLNLIDQGVVKNRQEVEKLPDESRVKRLGMRAQLIALEGNYHNLARITASGRHR